MARKKKRQPPQGKKQKGAPKKSAPRSSSVEYGKLLDNIPPTEPTKRTPSVRLLPSYTRLADNMEKNGVPRKLANAYARELQGKRGDFVTGAISRRAYQEWFYDDFYEPLFEDYGYEMHEDYPKKGK